MKIIKDKEIKLNGKANDEISALINHRVPEVYQLTVEGDKNEK